MPSAAAGKNITSASQLNPGVVGTSEVEDNSLTADDLAADSVAASEIAANAVGTSEIATGGVDTDEIADNAVALADMAHGTQGDVLYYGASGAPTLLGAGTSGQFLKTLGAGANPLWANAPTKFGGDGTDGALSISSGTTTLDMGNAKVFVKNYTSISITGTGKLAFSNPHASGSIVILKSQGDVTLTSSTAPMLDFSAKGAAGGVNAAGATSGGRGGGCGYVECAGAWNFTTANGISVAGGAGTGTDFGNNTSGAGVEGTAGLAGIHFQTDGGNGAQTGATTGGTAAADTLSTTANAVIYENIRLFCVGAGGGGGGGAGNGQEAGGGGGGGLFVGLYNSLTANTGTVTVSGGAGGTRSGTTNASSGAGGGGASAAGTNGNTNSNGGTGGAGLSIVIANTSFA